MKIKSITVFFSFSYLFIFFQSVSEVEECLEQDFANSSLRYRFIATWRNNSKYLFSNKSDVIKYFNEINKMHLFGWEPKNARLSSKNKSVFRLRMYILSNNSALYIRCCNTYSSLIPIIEDSRASVFMFKKKMKENKYKNT